MNVPTVIVEVRGGVVTAIYSDQQIDVKVMDYDDHLATTDQGSCRWFAELEDQAKTMTDYSYDA